MGKILIILGAALIVAGIIVYLNNNRIPFFGQLPGDFFFKSGSTTFYFPLASCIILSILVSIVIYLFSK